MNVIKIKIDFENGTNTIVGNSLISGDYASTKLEFEFDTEEGIKIFEMKNPKGEVVIAKEIDNNELLLAGVDENEEYYSLFEEGGIYTYEISLYVDGAKLTSAKGEIPVKQEQVIIDGEVVEPYLPVFDELLNEISNLNIEANKVDHTTTITITKKDGTSYDTLVLDGEKGDKGDPGAIKMQIVNELPTTGEEDTIYLVPNEGETGNNYDEYIYVEGAWEKLGGIQVEVDLTDYVKNTDYASTSKGGVVKPINDRGLNVNSDGQIIGENISYSDYLWHNQFTFISKSTLENVITGKGLVSNTNYANGTTAGVVKVDANYNGVNVGSSGFIFPSPVNYATYQTKDDYYFIGKGTLENVLNARIGDIDSVLDAINGESV